MEFSPAICLSCRRLEPLAGTCEAFPDGIPDEILMYGEDHRRSFIGDKGILYEPANGAEERFRDWEEFREALAKVPNQITYQLL